MGCFAVGWLMVVSGVVLHFVDRPGLRRGRVSAFRRGIRIVRAHGPLASPVHPRGNLQTAHGAGQWLTDRDFAFWGRETYRARSAYFAWTGLATRNSGDVSFEVRLLRGNALGNAGFAIMMIDLALFFVVIGELAVAAVAVAAAYWIVTSFQRERAAAEEIVAEFRQRFAAG